MRIGKPFDGYTVIHLCLPEVRAGMEVQVDDEFNCFPPFAVLTVQQHSDGRLFLTQDDGTPFFLDDHADECGDNPSRGLVGLYDPDPALRRPCVGLKLVDGRLDILEHHSH